MAGAKPEVQYLALKNWCCHTIFVPPGYFPKGSQMGKGLCAGSSTVSASGDGVGDLPAPDPDGKGEVEAEVKLAASTLAKRSVPWSIPLQEVCTTGGAVGNGGPQVESRLSDHMDSWPTPWARANWLTTTASARVNCSDATLFWPIIGMMPTFAQAWPSSRRRPACTKAARTWACSVVDAWMTALDRGWAGVLTAPKSIAIPLTLPGPRPLTTSARAPVRPRR